jgi:class 3 adenylate cyclase
MSTETADSRDATIESLREQQKAVSEVLRAVARSEGLDSVLHAVVEVAARLCDAEYGEVHLVDGEHLRLAVGHGGPPELYEYERQHPHVADRSTVTGRVALSRDVVHIPDIREDPEFSWSAATDVGIRTLLGAPLLLEGNLVGVFNIVRTAPAPFSDEQIELLRTFADQAAIAVANARLLDAVERQRMELSRFVSPQVAELVSSDDGEQLLAGHRAYISVLFCDLRGFTAFAETAAPEELMDVLRNYHRAMGELIAEHEGTLEHFAGDGLMVFFNDPLPVDAHEVKSIRFALAAQERFEPLAAEWRKSGTDLALGIGIASGYATLGRIGFEGRHDYGCIGPVTNLASRLSEQASPGQTLVSQRVYAAVEHAVEAELVGELELKGFGRPVVAYEVRAAR